MTETELKFALDPQAHGPLARSAALAGAQPVRTRLVSLYFDTPDCQLAKREMGLRLRRSGRRWVQTLKAGGAVQGALHARNEWEYSRRGPQLDLSLFAQTPLAELEGAESLHERLVVAFRVRVLRTTWRIAPAPDSRLEVALDWGTVESRARSAPISELEIECLEGGSAPAFDLAMRLLEDAALRPSAVTKAQRGYRLFRSERLRPAKARAPHLDPAMTPLTAATAVVGAGLEQLQANEEGLLDRTQAEFVHQARVALRRMRSALRMFSRVVGVERAQGWCDELAEVGRALGVARDWDVFATESLPAAASAYGDAKLARTILARAAKRRLSERERARGALRSPRYARVILDIARWMAQAQPPAPQAPAERLVDFASRLIRRRHKRLLERAHALTQLSAEERHQVRIDAKRLRYGVDALASLFKSRRVERYIEALSALQDALGRANDATTASRLLLELGPPEPFAAFARGWFGARGQGDALLLEAVVERLAESRRFWRTKASKPHSGAAAPSALP